MLNKHLDLINNNFFSRGILNELIDDSYYYLLTKDSDGKLIKYNNSFYIEGLALSNGTVDSNIIYIKKGIVLIDSFQVSGSLAGGESVYCEETTGKLTLTKGSNKYLGKVIIDSETSKFYLDFDVTKQYLTEVEESTDITIFEIVNNTVTLKADYLSINGIVLNESGVSSFYYNFAEDTTIFFFEITTSKSNINLSKSLGTRAFASRTSLQSTISSVFTTLSDIANTSYSLIISCSNYGRSYSSTSISCSNQDSSNSGTYTVRINCHNEHGTNDYIVRINSRDNVDQYQYVSGQRTVVLNSISTYVSNTSNLVVNSERTYSSGSCNAILNSYNAKPTGAYNTLIGYYGSSQVSFPAYRSFYLLNDDCNFAVSGASDIFCGPQNVKSNNTSSYEKIKSTSVATGASNKKTTQVLTALTYSSNSGYKVFNLYMNTSNSSGQLYQLTFSELKTLVYVKGTILGYGYLSSDGTNYKNLRSVIKYEMEGYFYKLDSTSDSYQIYDKDGNVSTSFSFTKVIDTFVTNYPAGYVEPVFSMSVSDSTPYNIVNIAVQADPNFKINWTLPVEMTWTHANESYINKPYEFQNLLLHISKPQIDMITNKVFTERINPNLYIGNSNVASFNSPETAQAVLPVDNVILNRYYEDRAFTVMMEYIHTTAAAAYAYRPLISNGYETGFGVNSLGYPMIYLIFYDYFNAGGYKLITTLGRTTAIQFVNGQKYNITFTYNGDKLSEIPARIWVNGIEQYTSNRPTVTTTEYSEFTATGKTINIGGQGAGQRVTVGKLAIWNKVLTDEQIASCNYCCESANKIIDVSCSEGSGTTLISNLKGLPNFNFYNISDLPNTRLNLKANPYNLIKGFAKCSNSLESGPSIPYIENHTFSLNDILIMGGGTVAINGLYYQNGNTYNSYPEYEMVNTSDFIIRRDESVGNRWTIFKVSTSQPVYSTNETNLTEPLSPNWITRTLGSSPVPTSYKIDSIHEGGTNILYNGSEHKYILDDTTTDSDLFLADPDRLLYDIDGTAKWFDITDIYSADRGYLYLNKDKAQYLSLYQYEQTLEDDLAILDFHEMNGYLTDPITYDLDGHAILEL